MEVIERADVDLWVCSAAEPAIWARPLGKGWVVVCCSGPANLALYRSVVRDVVYNLPQLDATKSAAQELAPDSAWGSLYTTLLRSGEIIAYNAGPEGPSGAQPLKATIGGHAVELAPH